MCYKVIISEAVRVQAFQQYDITICIHSLVFEFSQLQEHAAELGIHFKCTTNVDLLLAIVDSSASTEV